MDFTHFPENNTNTMIEPFLLDPLSVIIKLAILGNKPFGTKILILDNAIYLQKPGFFQPLYRKFFKSNKTDLQYIYNPIQFACYYFLSEEMIEKKPELINLFLLAQNGIKKLRYTYRKIPTIRLCLKYYYDTITNHIEKNHNEINFYKDDMTRLYTNKMVDLLNAQWSNDKIKQILNIISSLIEDPNVSDNIKLIDNIMKTIDENTKTIFHGI